MIQVTLTKDGTAQGVIGSTGNFYIADNSGYGFSFDNGGAVIYPSNSSGTPQNNVVNLGHSLYRWKDIYLGGGVFLGGTGTANKLDDYEEGTWTPQITDSSNNNATMSGSSGNFGKYTKIGNIVYVSARVQTTSISGLTGSNGAHLKGLPFTGVSQRSGGFINFHDFSLPSGATLAFLYFEETTDDFRMQKARSGSSTANFSVSELGVTSFGFSATYITN